MGFTFSNLQRTILATGLAIAASLLTITPAHAQGCIVARSNGEQGGPDSEGGYLMPGEGNFDIGYRHQFSYIHFVGPTEPSYRVQDGTEVMNKINLVRELSLSQGVVEKKTTIPILSNVLL